MRRIKAALFSPAGCVLLAAVLLGMLMSDMGNGQPHTELEKRIGAALTHVEKAGEIEVVIRTRVENDQEIPCGAVAVAPGAQDPIVQMELTQALCALLGLQAADVSVLVSGGEL